MARFTATEQRVLQAMYRLSRLATANEIADKGQMSWNTADKVLKELSKRGVVKGFKNRNRNYWKLNYK